MRPTKPSLCQPRVDPERTSSLSITVPRTPGQRESAAAIAEFFLEARSQVAGPFIRGGVRIAIVQDAQRTRHLAALMAIELFEEGNQRGGIFHRKVGAAGDGLVHVLMRRGSGLRGNRRLGGNNLLYRLFTTARFLLVEALPLLETYFFLLEDVFDAVFDGVFLDAEEFAAARPLRPPRRSPARSRYGATYGSSASLRGAAFLML